ncbi:MAG: sensor histidine kinase [Cyclobacteriaceae bacterium]
MNLRLYILLIILFAKTDFSLAAQGDSLLQQYHAADTYDEKAQLAYEYCRLHLYQNPDKCVKLASDIINHSEELSDSTMIFNFYNIPAIIYQKRNKLDSADILFGKAEEIANRLESQDLILKVNNNIGLLYRDRGEYKRALERWQVVLNGFRELKDLPMESYVLMNIGSTYYILENWTLGNQYHEEALQVNLSLEDPLRIGKSYSALSYSFSQQGSMDSARYFNEKAISYLEQTNDMFALANAKRSRCSDLGQIKKYQESCDCYLDVLELDKKMKNLKGIMICHKDLGSNYSNLSQYSLALNHLQEALKLSRQIGEKRIRQTIHYSLAVCYFNLNRFEKAYLHSDTSAMMQDSLRGSEIQEQLSELNVKYETSQKERALAEQDLEIQTKNATIAQQRNENILLIASIVIVILIVMIAYVRNSAIQKQKLQAAILSEKERGFESVLHATEEERKRISKDLHDGIGQQLSALKMALNNITEKTSDENHREDLELITEQFSKSADEVRQISHQMMPRALMEKGLIEAVDDLLQSSFQFSEIKYQFEHHNIDQRFEERIEISLYRIVQELVNNVIKHSEASEVSVQLVKTKDKLVLFLEDNGKGMSEGEGKGHGLINIKSRLDLVHGTVNYEPSPASGTSATVTIPINE